MTLLRNNTPKEPQQSRLELSFLGLIGSLDRLGFAFAGGVGPWITPVAPASVFGFSFWQSMVDQMGFGALIAGIAAGIGFVVAGAYSSHVAIMKPSLGTWSLVLAYISLEIFGLWAMSVDTSVKWVGTTVSLATLVVYITRAIDQLLKARRDHEAQEHEEEKQAKQNELEYQRQLEAKKLQQEHELRLLELNNKTEMAKFRAEQKAEVEIARVTSAPPQTQVAVPEEDHWPQGEFTRSDVEELFGLGSTAAKKRIRIARDSGLIFSPKRGTYILRKEQTNGVSKSTTE